MPGRLSRALAAIDVVNALDPEQVDLGGGPRPKELVHAELMTSWVRRLDPGASEVQLLAARAHHLRRWAVPRASYPSGRAGYLAWRADQQRRHADEVAEILVEVGYDPETVASVGRILRKEGLGVDPVVQVHEDALCLVFLSTQAAGVVDQLGEERALRVLTRTLAKMSDDGRSVVATLGLPEPLATLVASATAD